MQPIARKALEKLLASAERARCKSSGRAITLPFTDNSFPAYFDRRLSYDDKTLMHRDLRVAEQAGAITIEWDQKAGTSGQIQRLVLRDDVVLSDQLGVTPHWVWLEQAEQALAPWQTEPGVQRFLQAWRAYRACRGTEPHAVDLVVRALWVLEEGRRTPGVPVRRLSTRLFSNSKVVEGLVPLIDELTRGDDDPPTNDAQEVLHRVGVVRFPQPLLVGGHITMRLTSQLDTSHELQVKPPYTGVDPESVTDFTALDLIKHVVTIENLTTFHECARLAANTGGQHLVIYTGGMPSPAFRQCYRLLLANLPETVQLWHWGDIDRGGFRIARVLAREVKSAGRQFKPWLMNPAELQESELYVNADATCVKELKRLALDIGWDAIARDVSTAMATCEQESLSPRLPG